jgi:MSHA biogenesis protein MshG
MVGGILAAIVGFIAYTRTEDGATTGTDQAAHPIAGKIIFKATLARFARFFARRPVCRSSRA